MLAFKIDGLKAITNILKIIAHLNNQEINNVIGINNAGTGCEGNESIYSMGLL